VAVGWWRASGWISFSSHDTTAQSQGYFTDTDNSINQLVYNITPETQHWIQTVLPGKAAANENALATLVLRETAHVFYIGQNNIVNHLVKPPSSCWHNAANLKGDAAKAGSGLSCVTLVDDRYQVNYVSADDGSIQQNIFYLNSTQGVTWLKSQPPRADSPLGCVQSGGQVYYIGSSGIPASAVSRVMSFAFQAFQQKKQPLTAVELHNGTILVYYIDVEDRVGQLAYTAGSWTHQFP
jgi:hypothetical protein